VLEYARLLSKSQGTEADHRHHWHLHQQQQSSNAPQPPPPPSPPAVGVATVREQGSSAAQWLAGALHVRFPVFFL